MGTEDTTSSALPAAGSIMYAITNCNTPSCGLTTSHKQFLNSVGSVPAVGLLKKAQRVPSLALSLAPALVDEMTNEIAIHYAESVINQAITTYSGTATPKPDGFEESLTQMQNDLIALRAIKSGHSARMNVIVANIDQAIRASSRLFINTNLK
jgi:hypothetical protein